ncbi:hypothetical protein D9615_005193 [Tricholomella constricta]|uniref:Uncharacterized protein n=1 Tax=Tricholomella constricta TaxID=117010 RepID=A0A8H5M1L9_9AGAR|nr:hypothetical protein D9615_005193 [Tricholomella constricta]
MLKRQRPASPPPSMPTVPLLVHPLPFDMEARRDLKRRRVFPPSLDGNSRGWGVPIPASGCDDDDDEYMSNEDEPVERNGDRSAWPAHSSEYKAANNVLHELHTLQQHRLLFSSSCTSTSHIPVNDRSSVNPSNPDAHDMRSKMLTAPRPLAPIKDPAFDTSGSAGSHPSEDEIIRVTERYEDTNRSRSLTQT